MIVFGLVLLSIGALFIFLAGLGILKMPTFFMRMQTTSKASTLGVILVLTGASIMNQSLEAGIKTLIISFFLLLTTPVAVHALAEAATKLKCDQ